METQVFEDVWKPSACGIQNIACPDVGSLTDEI